MALSATSTIAAHKYLDLFTILGFTQNTRYWAVPETNTTTDTLVNVNMGIVAICKIVSRGSVHRFLQIYRTSTTSLCESHVDTNEINIM